MLAKYWVWIFVGGIALVAACKQTSQAEDQQFLQETGTVVAIYEVGESDVVFQLEHTDIRFVIPNGLDKGLNLELLRASLLNQEIRVSYPRYWTKDDPRNDDRFLLKVEYGGEVVFSEEY